jgi:hypothetical protein
LRVERERFAKPRSHLTPALSSKGGEGEVARGLGLVNVSQFQRPILPGQLDFAPRTRQAKAGEVKA